MLDVSEKCSVESQATIEANYQHHGSSSRLNLKGSFNVEVVERLKSIREMSESGTLRRSLLAMTLIGRMEPIPSKQSQTSSTTVSFHN